MAGWVDKQDGSHWRAIEAREVGQYLAMHLGIMEGYCEKRADRPLDPFAFAGDRGHQIRYEEGRKFAVLVQEREGCMPPWTDRSRPPPLLVSVFAEDIRRRRPRGEKF